MPTASAERNLLRIEIERLDEEGVRLARKALRSLSRRPGEAARKFPRRQDWLAFVAETYGSLREAPIERGPQGEFETRDNLG